MAARSGRGEERACVADCKVQTILKETHPDERPWSCKDPEHGHMETLYCSNAPFFREVNSQTLEPHTSLTPSNRLWTILSILKGWVRLSFFVHIDNKDLASTTIPDIEDIRSRLHYKPQSTNLPLVLELFVWENGEFVSDEKIAERIKRYKSLYPPNRQVSGIFKYNLTCL